MIDEIGLIFEHELKLEPIDQQQFIGTDQIQPTTNTLPAFNFRKTSLSRPAREQLARIYKSVLAGVEAASKRSGLRNLILTNIFNPVSRTYIPVNPNVYLVGKLPTVSSPLGVHRDVLKPLKPFGAALFTNALVIPDGWGRPDFDPKTAPAPRLRLTNFGFLVVTIEYDCETADQFEEILSWTRGRNGNGKTKSSAFSKVDQELCKLSDYRGYSIVLSGSRSLHFHLIFSTTHLKNAPYQALAEERQKAFREHSALLENAYRIYWDHTNDVFEKILEPSLQADRQLRQATQWRRTPWEIRTLDKPSTILGLAEGTEVPQMVIREDIRTRASKTNQRFLVPKSYSIASSISVPTKPSRQGPQTISGDISLLIQLLQEECRSEWGEYPKPVQVSQQHNDWVINFRNHPGDKKPSTIVMGSYRQLSINGHHDFGDRKFFLPDHMTANALVDYLALRSGLATVASTKPASQPSNASTNPATSRWCHAPVLDEYSDKFRGHFAEPLSDKPLQEIKETYRDKLWHAFFQSRDLSDKIVIQSGEGIGKTRTLLPLLSDEAQDDALTHYDNIQRFAALAFRSHEQARLKADEFRIAGYSVVVWRSFWDHYKEACAILKQKEIARDEFEDTSPKAVLAKIKKHQPLVFDHLEEARKALWQTPATFTSYSTVLLMTHRTVQTWDAGTLTRAWHHPEFDPNGSVEDHHKLRDRIKLSRVVLDDPEADDFLHVLSESTFDFLQRMHKSQPDWRNLRRAARLSFYRRLKAKKELPGTLFADFEQFNELMHVNLTTLDMVAVDFKKISFGYDQTDSGIYRARHGDKYYIGTKPWLFGADRHVTFLTTETLVSDAIVGAAKRFRHRGGQSKEPFWLPLDQVPGIYPIKVPVIIDKRAKREKITELAREITKSNDNAIVISDMVRNVSNVKTFQGMKGVNGLETNDIYIVVTCLSPAKYAELNVIGQWLEIPNIIQKYYQDQINQAVGRNRGFRQSPNSETKTVVITSLRLWNNVLRDLLNQQTRVLLYESADRPW